MKKIILNEVLRPLVHRAGTAAGVWLASLDVFTQGQIATLEQGAVIVAGFALDLLVRRAL